MKYLFNEKQMRTLSVLLAGVICLLTEACTEPQTDMSRLCGEWKSAIGKPDIRIAKDGKCYKLTLFAKRGMTGRMMPETYVIQQKGGAMFIDTGFHIDMTYHQERDMLTFSTNGEYVRKQ